MKKYLQHVKSLYTRPTLNGIDGHIKERGASPFELFLDLIIVIALSKTASLYEMQTMQAIFTAILFFIIIYSGWFTLTTYTVMFMQEEINYWLRAMIFIIMLPLIFLLGLTSLNTHLEIFIFCTCLALNKIMLAFIFRDSILNAPLNNIAVSNVYIMIARHQIFSACFLFLAAFSINKLMLAALLLLVAINDAIITPNKQKRIMRAQKFPIPINLELMMERNLLFTILIFGEGLISIVSNIYLSEGALMFVNVALIFGALFLFYTRLAEESQFNIMHKNNSISMQYNLIMNIALFILFVTLGEVPHFLNHGQSLPFIDLLIIVSVLIYIVTSHLITNLRLLKIYDDPLDRLFHIVDVKLLIIMYFTISLLFFFHNSVFAIYFIIFCFFFLHVLALPFRRHLITNDCTLAKIIIKK